MLLMMRQYSCLGNHLADKLSQFNLCVRETGGKISGMQ